MSKKVKVIVLRTAGTNCDMETVFAFEKSGAVVDLVHINKLFNGEKRICDYHILAIPGGFTYGDDIISGRIFANELRLKLGSDIIKFINEGKLIIGICNGFQVLVRAGFLPGPVDGSFSLSNQLEQSVSLTYNNSGKFEDRWTYLRLSGNSVWTQNIDDILYIPVAHAEGKFIPKDDNILNKIKENNQIIFRYCDANGNTSTYPDNPNGSIDDIAGISDKTGRILGLMPHPERHFLFTQHPFWTRLDNKNQLGQGAKIFQNGVDYVNKNLL